MPINVHILREPSDTVLAYLRGLLDPEVYLTSGCSDWSPTELDILVSGRPEREHLTNCQYLQALIVPYAGIPPETRVLLTDFPDLKVHNLHYNAAATAEVAIALLLAAGKFIVPMDRALRANDWSPRYQPNPSILMEGRTALVLGYGAVGRRVARMCRGLGMRVLAVRRGPLQGDEDPGIEIHPTESLFSLLPKADALIICLPHTPQTDNMIGARALQLLPDGAVLVNVGRGAIVDEEALYNALSDGTLYAAGLDVWYNYPEEQVDWGQTAPSRFPFYELDNVVMSPHRAGGANDLELRRMEALAAMLNLAARGLELPNRVDIVEGY